MKENVHVETIHLGDNELFNDVYSVIDLLTNVRKKYNKDHSIELEQEYIGYEDRSFQIVVRRLETDNEYNKRLEKEKKEELKEKERHKKLEEKKQRKLKIQQQTDNLKKKI
jgi:hypothetical protein